MSKKLVIIRFYDRDVDSEPFLAETTLDEKELRELVYEIKNALVERGYYDWTYEDLIHELEKRGVIRTIDVDGYYEIFA